MFKIVAEGLHQAVGPCNYTQKVQTPTGLVSDALDQIISVHKMTIDGCIARSMNTFIQQMSI